MEEFFGFIFIGIFMEVIFWGISYIIGRILTPLISLGRWRAEAIRDRKDIHDKCKKQKTFTLTSDGEQVYLGAFAVAFIGMLFWLIVIILFLIT